MPAGLFFAPYLEGLMNLRSRVAVFALCGTFVVIATLTGQTPAGQPAAGQPPAGRAPAGQTPAPGGGGQGRGGGGQPVTIRAARVLDGKGNVLQNGVVEVAAGKITAVDQRTGPVTYDLGDATVLPGMIDVHVHLNWTFGPDGRYGGGGVIPSYTTDAVLDNARATVMAGFTTVQSVGWAGDKGLREAIGAGI